MLWAFAGSACVCLILIVPIALQWRMRYAGEFTNRYAANPQWWGLVFPGLIAALMVLLITAAVVKAPEWDIRRQPRRWVPMLLVGVLVVLKFVLHFAAVTFLAEFSLAGAVWPFVQRLGDGAYNVAASQIDSVPEFLDGFQAQFLESERDPLLPHLETHPPGPTLAFYLLQEVLDALPALRAWLERVATDTSPILRDTLAEAVRSSQVFRHGLAVSFAAALICFSMAALVPAFAYLLAREFAGRSTAFLVAGICALFPGSFCYSPGIDQTLAVPALLMCLFAVRSARSRSTVSGLLSGLTAFACLFTTLAFLVPLGMLFWAAVVAVVVRWGRGRPSGEDPVKSLRPYVLPMMACGAGFLVPVILLRLLTGFNLLSVLLLCYTNNATWHGSIGNTYWPWAFSNLVETLYSMGAPACFGLLAVLCLWGTRFRDRTAMERGGSFYFGVHFTFLLLCVLAVNKGEVARIWLFLFPILWASGSGVLEPAAQLAGDPDRNRRWATVGLLVAISLQALYVLVLATSVDGLETAKTFHNVLWRAQGG